MDHAQRRTIVAGTAVLLMSLLGRGSPADGQQTERTRIDIQNHFPASGWMGDGEYGRRYIDFSGANREKPHSPPTSIKITYSFGPIHRWGGIYWQNEPDNWGDKPGNNYSKKGLSKITFWARGETGTEVVEFMAGGIDNPKKKYRDSFRVTTGRVTLPQKWQQYQIDLSNADLSSVIGGFGWVASADYNSAKEITFFLDDILLE